MIIPPFSTCVACDMAHFRELQLASLTWKKNRPEIWQPQNPLLVFVDTAPSPRGESEGWWTRKIERCIDHPNMQVIGWPDVPGATQRHRMLSAFVYGAAEHVKTQFLLKLDTDTLCLKCENRFHPDWISSKQNYCYVSGSWGYTRGIAMWKQLLEWAKTVPVFQGKPEVPGIIDEAKNAVRHQRIISFFFWAQTNFIKLVASLHPGPLLPIASQDTTCFYVATRLGLPRGACRIKRFGLFHGSRGMEKRVKAILEET